MIISEGRLGRVFVLRLGDGDRIPDAIEEFARTRGVTSALVAALAAWASAGWSPVPKTRRPCRRSPC